MPDRTFEYTDDELQAVRRSHCAKAAEPDHHCVGSTTITPKGLKLDCNLCGSEDRTDKRWAQRMEAYRKVCDVLRLVGIDPTIIEPDRLIRAALELCRDACPMCQRLRPYGGGEVSQPYVCPCGNRWRVYSGWEDYR